jgi:hypothetical protein
MFWRLVTPSYMQCALLRWFETCLVPVSHGIASFLPYSTSTSGARILLVQDTLSG